MSALVFFVPTSLVSSYNSGFFLWLNFNDIGLVITLALPRAANLAGAKASPYTAERAVPDYSTRSL